jgi:hypothetical protein
MSAILTPGQRSYGEPRHHRPARTRLVRLPGKSASYAWFRG